MAPLVGIVTTVGCPHCKRAKAALKKERVAYEEADLATARDVLAKVKETTGQTTVPQVPLQSYLHYTLSVAANLLDSQRDSLQMSTLSRCSECIYILSLATVESWHTVHVFIGTDFVGGASQLVEIIEKGELSDRLAAAAGKPAFPDSIAQLVAMHAKEAKSDNVINPELLKLKPLLKEKVARVKCVNSRPPWCYSILLQRACNVMCSCGYVSVLWTLSLSVTALTERCRVGKSSLSGVKREALEDFLAAEQSSFTVDDLLESRLVAPMPGNSAVYVITDDARAQPLKLGQPLNCHIEWHGPARSAVEVSGDLRARILALYDSYLSADGKGVDYGNMKGDPQFDAYVDATVELTKVDLSDMGREGMFGV
jgi:glutaredoxin